MIDSKYVVFKRNELFEMLGQFLPEHGDCAPVAQRMTEAVDEALLDDAVVIRRQDVFAPPALDAYANAIMCAVEIFKADGGPIGRADQLEKIAQYFHEQATMSWDTNRKLPD